MTDRPILFSGPMIRALLEGRKTQTRRVLNKARVFATPETRAFTLSGDDMARALQNADRFRHLGGDGWFWEADAFEWQAPATRTGWMAHIGYAPGDRLWVREGFFGGHPGCANITYRADQIHAMVAIPWKPSIHMPRWASRLTLIVTDVRVQRLQEISEEDADAEGTAHCDQCGDAGWINSGPDGGWECTAPGCGDAYVDCFRHTWDGLNAERGFGWDVNPWVVALTFEVIRQNIDAMGEAA
ncbi:hypothetical protein [uncultured Nitratireductor sp.]|uniref:hypothetical protein n=1 Tax=uncultured Nitratireductor sp. TaxID=520953 RepID=UPI0025D3705E|nr:hypothetical protein [uncultured Nitratireductor sp.]